MRLKLTEEGEIYDSGTVIERLRNSEFYKEMALSEKRGVYIFLKLLEKEAEALLKEGYPEKAKYFLSFAKEVSDFFQ